MAVKLMVTGSSGLVGRELCRRLDALAHEVVPFDLKPMAGEPSRDLRDGAALGEALDGCDGVFHLAAVSRVAWGEMDPARCAEINVECTRSLVELMRRQGGAWLVFASSREVYGDVATKLVSESDGIAPINVYGRSKADGEAIIEEGRTRGLRTAIIRLSNVYGTVNDHPDRAVPALLWRALTGEPIELTGGSNYFDFVHVEDAVDGLLAAAKLLEAGEATVPTVHLSTGMPTSLRELAELAIETARSSSPVHLKPARTFDVPGFCGDPTLAGQILRWRARIPLRVGMEKLSREMLASTSPIPPAVMPGPFER